MVEHGRDFRLMLGPTAFQISVSPAGEAAFKDEVESGIPISGRASFFKRYPRPPVQRVSSRRTVADNRLLGEPNQYRVRGKERANHSRTVQNHRHELRLAPEVSNTTNAVVRCPG